MEFLDQGTARTGVRERVRWKREVGVVVEFFNYCCSSRHFMLRCSDNKPQGGTIAVIAARDKMLSILRLVSAFPVAKKKIMRQNLPLSQLTSFEFFHLADDLTKYWSSDLWTTEYISAANPFKRTDVTLIPCRKRFVKSKSVSGESPGSK